MNDKMLEKFDAHYDLRAAITHNAVAVPPDFELIAEVLSEAHDEGEYFWIIQDVATKNFFVINGSHDYTGWDCQSGASISEPFESLEKLHLFVPEYDNQNRKVRELLLAQIKPASEKAPPPPPAAE